MLSLIGALISKYGLQSINLILLVSLVYATSKLLRNHLVHISSRLDKQSKKMSSLCKSVNKLGERVAHLEGRLEK